MLEKSYFGRSLLFWVSSLVLVVGLGLGIRLYDLTDPPLDFNPTRQIRSAVIARGMYYQMQPSADPELRQKAVAYWHSMVEREPQFLERIVSYAYLVLGGERLWVARIITSVAWVIGGLALFGLARRMASVDGAIIATAYYLFLPFGIQASRSFQPDPVMVMFFLLFAYAYLRWLARREWKWSLLAGIFAGAAVLMKVVAVYLVAGMFLAALLFLIGFRKGIKDWQIWMMAAFMIVPAGIYYLFDIRGESLGFLQGSTLSVYYLIFSPSFYIQWLNRLRDLFGISLIFFGLAGVLISTSRNRVLLLGIWAGYGLYGISFPHHITTHDYYNLQLIPIVALSLAPIASLVLSKATEQRRFWQIAMLAVLLLSAAYPLWTARSIMAGQDYQAEPVFWQEVSAAIPDDGKTIALTQDYGHRLMYFGWKKVSIWPNNSELKLTEARGNSVDDFLQDFEDRTEGEKYFLVTSFGQLDSQPTLKSLLYNGYPIIAEGEGYIVFNLQGTGGS